MVTEISGRGVGLDVVATRLRALAGSIDIRSRQGEGLTIELRFQASLVATHALFVRDGGQVFGIASHAVRRAVPAVAVELVRERGDLYARRRRSATPRTNWPRSPASRPPTAPERRNLVLVDTDTGPLGLLVDAILDASELVTRPAGRYLKRIPGVAGIGLLGDGSVIPLLDVAELARSPQRTTPARRGRGTLAGAGPARAHACWWSTTRCRCAAPSPRCSRTRATTSMLARDGLEAVKSMDVAVPTCCSPISKCPT